MSSSGDQSGSKRQKKWSDSFSAAVVDGLWDSKDPYLPYFHPYLNHDWTKPKTKHGAGCCFRCGMHLLEYLIDHSTEECIKFCNCVDASQAPGEKHQPNVPRFGGYTCNKTWSGNDIYQQCSYCANLKNQAGNKAYCCPIPMVLALDFQRLIEVHLLLDQGRKPAYPAAFFRYWKIVYDVAKKLHNTDEGPTRIHDLTQDFYDPTRSGPKPRQSAPSFLARHPLPPSKRQPPIIDDSSLPHDLKFLSLEDSRAQSTTTHTNPVGQTQVADPATDTQAVSANQVTSVNQVPLDVVKDLVAKLLVSLKDHTSTIGKLGSDLRDDLEKTQGDMEKALGAVETRLMGEIEKVYQDNPTAMTTLRTELSDKFQEVDTAFNASFTDISTRFQVAFTEVEKSMGEVETRVNRDVAVTLLEMEDKMTKYIDAKMEEQGATLEDLVKKTTTMDTEAKGMVDHILNATSDVENLETIVNKLKRKVDKLDHKVDTLSTVEANVVLRNILQAALDALPEKSTPATQSNES